MITHDQAENIVKNMLGKNLVIADSFESEEAWCFGLAIIDENRGLMNVLGNNIIRISKEDGSLISEDEE